MHRITVSSSRILLSGSPYTSYQTFAFDSRAYTNVPMFRVTVSCLTPGGNVDLFGGYNPPYECPTSTNNIPAFTSTNGPPLAQVVNIPNQGPGFYYFSVAGFTAGNNLFSITLQDASAPTPLAPGVPSEGMLAYGAPPTPVSYMANFSLTVR